MGKECDVAYILSLGVHKKFRRNGIGSLLLDALINYLRTSEKTKVKAIFLHVLTTNQPAILFYEKRRYTLENCEFYWNQIKSYHHFCFVSFCSLFTGFECTHFYRIIIRLKVIAKMVSHMCYTSTTVIRHGRYLVKYFILLSICECACVEPT